jgi:proline dehydrogenase
MSSVRSQVPLLGRMTSRLAPFVPAAIVRQLGKPYVAGETLQDALETVADLRRDGLETTVDILGESVSGIAGIAAVADAYIQTLDALDERGLRSHLSLKPSGLGSSLGWDVCGQQIERVVRRAQDGGSFVRVDMEDASTVGATLDLYRRLRADGLTAVGVVLQSRLWRSAGDVKSLADLAPNVRLCKGIYLEPPDLAVQDRDAVRRSFSKLLRALLAGGSFVGIATHDEVLVIEALRIIDELGLDRDAYEFQMLLGVRADLALLLSREHRVRIYVPYGSDSFAYAQRRMRENPEMAGHIAKEVLAGLSRVPRTVLSGGRAGVASSN